MSIRETCAIVARVKGAMPEEGVNPVEFPARLDYLWSWYLSLHAQRQRFMGEPQPVSEADIGWFFSNRGIALQGWEPDAIRQIDNLVMTELSKTTVEQ